MGYGSARIPFVPFPQAIALPTCAPDEPGAGGLVTLNVNTHWIGYILAACEALRADSTWDAPDIDNLRQVRAWVSTLILMLIKVQPAMQLVFRNNPTHPQNLDFSTDGGATWNLTADTAAQITPQFVADSGAPSGYQISVNAGYTSTAIPLLTANDPKAVVTDPLSDLVNQIVPGSDINALKLAAQGDATPLQLVNAGITLANLLELVVAL